MMDPSTPLTGLPLAVVDCESSALPGAPDCYVVEVAVVHAAFGSDDIRVAYSSRVRVPVPIPESATRVHGITDADVADCPTWAEVGPEVAAACAGRLLVGYNAVADDRFLTDDNARIGLAPPPWPWLDLLVIRKALKRRGAPGKLTEVAAEHNIILDAHGAVGDAFATAMLVRPMMRDVWKLGVKPRTVGELLAWQRETALETERDYAEYCRKRGDSKPPRCDWHEREGVPAPTWEPAKRTAYCPQCGAPVANRIGKDGRLVVVSVEGGETHRCAT